MVVNKTPNVARDEVDRLKATLEVESGANDPAGIALTITPSTSCVSAEMVATRDMSNEKAAGASVVFPIGEGIASPALSASAD